MAASAKNKIKIFNKPKNLSIKINEISEWANDVLLLNSVTGVQVNIVFVTLPEISAMNRKFRGKDKPTDVITFSMLEGKFKEYSLNMLGDIYVCPDFIKPNNNREVLRRVVHGLLHLLGNDHKGETALRKFVSLEDKFLRLIDTD
ncbi:MAG: rRNA maturation RNase YbeY [bacterium]|nr:rRNA maturation RNase YbeY [bacterium]